MVPEHEGVAPQGRNQELHHLAGEGEEDEHGRDVDDEGHRPGDDACVVPLEADIAVRRDLGRHGASFPGSCTSSGGPVGRVEPRRRKRRSVQPCSIPSRPTPALRTTSTASLATPRAGAGDDGPDLGALDDRVDVHLGDDGVQVDPRDDLADIDPFEQGVQVELLDDGVDQRPDDRRVETADDVGDVDAVEHLLDVDAGEHRVQVHADHHEVGQVGQDGRVEPGQHLGDVDALQHGVEIDLLDEPLEVDRLDQRLQVDAVDHGLYVDALHDLVDVDGVHDAGHDSLGHLLHDPVGLAEQRAQHSAAGQEPAQGRVPVGAGPAPP